MKRLQSTPQIIVIVLSVMTIAFGIAAFYENATSQELSREYDDLDRQTTLYQFLKSQWGSKAGEDDLNQLKSLPTLLKSEKRGGNLYLEFGNLSPRDFNQIANTLLNSKLVIKKMDLQRTTSGSGTITVEIEQ